MNLALIYLLIGTCYYLRRVTSMSETTLQLPDMDQEDVPPASALEMIILWPFYLMKDLENTL